MVRVITIIDSVLSKYYTLKCFVFCVSVYICSVSLFLLVIKLKFALSLLQIRQHTHIYIYNTYYYQWLYIPLLGLGRSLSFFILYRVGGLLGRGISPAQGRYLHTGQHKCRINAHKHPYFEWDSNTQSRYLSARRAYASCLTPLGQCDRNI
jgi:hypothetical protein